MESWRYYNEDKIITHSFYYLGQSGKWFVAISGNRTLILSLRLSMSELGRYLRKVGGVEVGSEIGYYHLQAVNFSYIIRMLHGIKYA